MDDSSDLNVPGEVPETEISKDKENLSIFSLEPITIKKLSSRQQ